MSKKKLLIAVIALVVVIAALVVLWKTTRPELGGKDADKENPVTGSGEAEGDSQEETFTVIVVHADGSEKTFTYAYEDVYLGQVLQEKVLVEGTQETYGLYMKVVDGERAVYEDDGAYWAFYVGDAYAMLGIDQTPITVGEVYKLVYTKG